MGNSPKSFSFQMPAPTPCQAGQTCPQLVVAPLAYASGVLEYVIDEKINRLLMILIFVIFVAVIATCTTTYYLVANTDTGSSRT